MGWYDNCERCNGGNENHFSYCEWCNENKAICDHCGWCPNCGHYRD